MREVATKGRHRSLHLSSLVAASVLVGAVVFAAARAFAGASCNGTSAPAFGSPCPVLVSSLAVRVGVVAALATVLMGLVNEGLARTAERMEQDRRTLAEEVLAGAVR